MKRLVLALGALLGGCVTVGNFQRAETLGKGGWEVGIESSAYGLPAPEGSQVVPMLGISVRGGVTRRFDLGGRVSSGAAELQGKVQLTPPRGDGPVIVSLAPTVGGSGIGFGGYSVGLVYGQLPVLVGIPIGESELTFSPKFVVATAFSGSDELSGTATRLGVGAGVGFAARVTKKLTLVPEVSALPKGRVIGSAAVADEVDLMSNTLVYQAGLGILIGKKR